MPGGEKGVYIQVWAPLSSPAWGAESGHWLNLEMGEKLGSVKK